jgi:hypothetical protein
MTDENTITLTPELRAACEQAIEGTEFQSVEAYVQFVLREVVTEPDAGAAESADRPAGTEDQLEALGYLDR